MLGRACDEALSAQRTVNEGFCLSVMFWSYSRLLRGVCLRNRLMIVTFFEGFHYYQTETGLLTIVLCPHNECVCVGGVCVLH